MQRSRPAAIVIHSGARLGYAIPATFAREGLLARFYTDLCSQTGVGRIASAAARAPLPRRLRASAKGLASRTPPQEVVRQTRTVDLAGLQRDAAIACSLSSEQTSHAQALWNERLGRRIIRDGFNEAGLVYTVLAEGGPALDAAKAGGLKIASDVIIALSANRIVADECRAFPNWGEAPPDCSRDAEYAKRYISVSDLLVCPSDFVRRDLIENWGARPEATRLVPYAAPPQWFNITPAPEVGRILFAGTASLRKGLHYYALAANQLLSRGRLYDFRAAGGVSEAVRVQAAAKGLSFLGRLPRDLIIEEFRRADVFVLPSLAEGSAGVIYEALAAGVPVITTRSSGSVVRDGIDGIITPERDPEALAYAIESIVEDRQRRDAMAAAARERAQNYTWGRYGERLLAAVYAHTPCEP